MAVPFKISPRALSKELAKLASAVHTCDEQGNEITKEQALADLVWKMALGWEELVKDEDTGQIKRTKHAPLSWAIQYLYERLEGRAAVASPDNAGGIKAAERVGDLAKQRINQLAAIKAGPPTKKES